MAVAWTPLRGRCRRGRSSIEACGERLLVVSGVPESHYRGPASSRSRTSAR